MRDRMLCICARCGVLFQSSRTGVLYCSPLDDCAYATLLSLRKKVRDAPARMPHSKWRGRRAVFTLVFSSAPGGARERKLLALRRKVGLRVSRMLVRPRRLAGFPYRYGAA
jgi:hypothetical protein